MKKLLVNGFITVLHYSKENRFLLISIGCLVGALAIASQDYVYTEKFLWFWDKAKKTNIQPALVSTICAFFLVLPVFIRCKANIIHDPSIIKLILLFLDALVVATFINCMITNENIIPGIDVNGYTFLAGGLIISWIGIRAIAGYVWILLIISSLFRIIQVDHAMGIHGAAYICLCVIGIILQINYVCGGVNEARQLLGEEFNPNAVKMQIKDTLHTNLM